QRDAVGEIRITEPQVVIERVINRVINAAVFVFAPVADVQRSDAEVLQKGSVIRTGAERLERNRRTRGDPLGALPVPFLRPLLVSLDQDSGPEALKHSHAGLRITHSGGDLIKQSLKRLAAARSEETASIGIGVYVQHRLSPQFVGVSFHPFR